MTVVTSTPLTLAFAVPNITDILGTFDQLVWYRSRTGQDGLYEAATAGALAAAMVTGRDPEPFQLNGRTLSFKVNGVVTVDVTFSGADPYDLAAVIADIAGETALVVASDVDGTLRLTTVATGSSASIEILSSDASPYLGFDVGQAAVGLDANTVLAGGTYQYFYTDQNSDPEFFYRVQFFNSDTLEVSELSVPITGDQAQVVPYSNTAVAYIQLSDAMGRALPRRKITIATSFQPNTVAGYGIFRQTHTIETDRTGYAEIRLLKGAKVDISIDGTGFVRRITVPDDLDVFDMLSPDLAVDDEFGIQDPNIDFAIRTS